MDAYFKHDVSQVQGVQLPTIRGMIVMAGVMKEYGKRFTIPSINDGKHSDGSKHYEGLAFDTRTRDEGPHFQQWPDELKRQIAQTARNRLGPDYDVVVERTHIHTEFHPK